MRWLVTHHRAAVAGVLIAIAGDSGLAHAQAAADTTPGSAHAAITRLVSATRRADWQTMRPFFPAGTRWEAIIEGLVLNQDTSRAFSFWLRGVRIEPDSLKVQMLTRDSAMITTPFRVRGANGEWEAIMVRRDSTWVLARTKESFGRRERLLP